MTGLNLSENSLGTLVVPEGWTHYSGNSTGKKFKYSDGSYSPNDCAPEGTTSGAIIIADAIKDMGALIKATIKLDISSNNIGAAQGEDLQRICAAGGIELVK
jgi:hypothetical protein